MAKYKSFNDFIRNGCNEKEFFCIKFADNRHLHKTHPHYYFCVPNNLRNCFLLVMITSQVEKKRKLYINNEKAQKSLIYVDDTNLSFLKKESVIDCNEAEMLMRDELFNICVPRRGREIVCFDNDIQIGIKLAIINGIKNSPIVKPYIKNSILPLNHTQ